MLTPAALRRAARAAAAAAEAAPDAEAAEEGSGSFDGGSAPPRGSPMALRRERVAGGAGEDVGPGGLADVPHTPTGPTLADKIATDR